jgi:glutaredoxin
VPQVWLDGVHIGGHKEFQHWLKENQNEQKEN